MTSLNTSSHAFESNADTPIDSASWSESATRLDRLPVGRFHFRIMSIIGAGLFVDAFEVILASSVLGALQKSGWSNLHLTSLFVSATFAGLLIGGWMAGMVGDHVGRKASYQLNLLIFGGASFAAFFAPSMYFLIGCRFIMGIGLGAELVLGYSTLAEFVPPSKRGRLSAAMALITQTGGFAASLASAWVIPHMGWRYMFLIAALGASIVWFMRRFMPESPRWLESRGRLVESRAILDSIEVEAYRGQPRPADVVRPIEAGLAKAAPKLRVWALFSPKYLRSTLIGVLVMATMQVCLYGLVTWLPTFFVSLGHSMEEALRWNAYIAIGQPVGGIIAIAFVDRIGRKAMLCTAAMTAIVMSVIYLTATVETPALLVTMGLIFMVVTSVLTVVGQGIYLSELFPTQLRARGAGISSSLSRMLSIGVQALVPIIFATYHINGILLAVDGVLIFFTVVLLTFGVETKQRRLESIA